MLYKTKIALSDKTVQSIQSGDHKPLIRNIGALIDFDFGQDNQRVLIHESLIISISIEQMKEEEVK